MESCRWKYEILYAASNGELSLFKRLAYKSYVSNAKSIIHIANLRTTDYLWGESVGDLRIYHTQGQQREESYNSLLIIEVSVHITHKTANGSTLTLNSIVAETYITAFQGLLGPGSCNFLPI